MKKIIKSFTVFVVAVALISPVGARAQTTAELQAQIASLLTQITQLQAQLNAMQTGGIAPVSAGFMFTSDMTVGSRGVQVEELQKFLVARGFLVMPPGVPFGYFGPLTQGALARFQASQGISPSVGYFGPITRARVNSLVVVVPPVVPPTTLPTTPGTGITTPGVEGIMSVINSNAGLVSTVYEGDSMAPILGMRVEARISDIAVQRVKIDLGSNTTIYNRILERLYVTDGSNVLAQTDLNSGTVVREGNRYFVTITGFNYVVPAGSNRDIVIRADVRPTVDSTNLGFQSIRLADNGVRGVDGAGIDHYSPGSGSSVSRSFNVQKSLVETARLRISLNNDSPKAQEVVASSGSNRNELDRLALLSFDLRSERDDVKITDLTVNLVKSGIGGANASSTVYLYDGSTEIDNASVSASGVATFNNLDYVVPNNSTRTLSVRTDIRNADGNLAYISANINSSGIVAQNSIGDNISGSNITGSANGFQIGLRNIGPQITLVSKSITTSGVPQGGTVNNFSTSALTANFTLRIRAVGADIVLGSPASTSPAFTGGESFAIYRNGVMDPTISSVSTSTSYSIPSGATTGGLVNSFRITEGSEVTIPVTFQILGRRADDSALISGLYSIGFEGFTWISDGVSGTTSFMSGEQDWRTNDVSFP
jgi:peptidoglycan hydrolase-like protein with peptidoglycan-binding domain